MISWVFSMQLDRRQWMLRMMQVAGLAALARSGASGQNATPWAPQILTPDENEALIALGESIIPGSRAAQCSRLIDLVLTQEDPQLHQQLTGAIDTFDQASRAQFQKAFRNLTPDQQAAILTAASSAANPLHPQFQIVKEWTADAYWSSEQGLKELGSTGRMAWDSFPGCEHVPTSPR
jgi:hypothetical protein